MKYNQNNAPIKDALLRHKKSRVVPFDVPGHKSGRGTPELTEFLGSSCLRTDVNSMKSLDNLIHPVSVIKEAAILASKAFRAENAFFMVNGTSAAVQTMILATCKPNDKIILPRNVHRSAINSLILSGAIPIYVNPGVNDRLGIPLAMSLDDLRLAILNNPDAKAVFVNNPTYYGVCSNLKEIVNLCHKNNIKVLVDEAHGAHFYFADSLPISAMDAGADMAAVSMHKTGGSLTQSSFLLTGSGIDPGYINQVINLTQTTSASYLLLSSLDIARKNMAINGKDIFRKTLELSNYARYEINQIGGFYGFSSEIINNSTVYDFDNTKLSINTTEIGLTGIEVYDLLRDEYDIQIEFGDISNILAVISAGDRAFEIERLISALSEIKRLYSKEKIRIEISDYISPKLVLSPKDAFYANKKSIPLKESKNMVSAEFLMCYPPGIPILAPGEMISKDIIDYILFAKEKDGSVTGTADTSVKNINIVTN